MLALLLGLWFVTQESAARFEAFGPPARFALSLGDEDPVLDGHGPCELVRCDASPEQGRVWFWATSEELVPLVFAGTTSDPNGELDPGGELTSWGSWNFEGGAALFLFVASDQPGATGAVELHIAAAPETEETLAAVEAARRELDAIEGLRGDPDAARTRVGRLVATLLRIEGRNTSDGVAAALVDSGVAAFQLGEVAIAGRAFDAARAHLARARPDHHSELQQARHLSARAMRALGDLAGARELQERVVAIYAETRPAEDSELLKARQSLGSTLYSSGDLEGASAVFEEILEVHSRTLSAEHPDLQSALSNAALMRRTLGDLDGALALQERVLEIRMRTLPEDDATLQNARINLALTVRETGDPARARELETRALAVLSRSLPAEHPTLLMVRQNLAITLKELGELGAARELEEQVLAAREQSLPESHPDLQLARSNLAVTLAEIGDLAGARELQEAVLAAYAGQFEERHPYVAAARTNLALTLEALGDHVRAYQLLEGVLAARAPALGRDHPELLRVRVNLAVAAKGLGHHARARELEERVLESRVRTLPAGHFDIQIARMNLANTLTALGELDRARELQEHALAAFEESSSEHELSLRLSRTNVGWARTRADDAAGVAAVAGDLGRGVRRALREAALTSSPRETSARAGRLAIDGSHLLAFAAGAGRLPPNDELLREAFAVVEMLRSAELIGPALTALVPDDAELRALRVACQRASEELVAQVRTGAEQDELREARRARDAAWEELVARVEQIPAARNALADLTPEALAGEIDPGTAVVGYWRYTRMEVSRAESAVALGGSEHLLAFVIGPDGELARVELGPMAAIEEAVIEWRGAIDRVEGGRGFAANDEETTEVPGARDALGERVRELIVDPVLTSIDDRPRTLVTALDDVLHAIPLDALPFENGVLGDDIGVQVRCSLRELLFPGREILDSAGTLVAFGGVDYGTEELAGTGHRSEERAAAVRGGVGAFQPLPATAAEIAELGALWSSRAGGEPELLSGTRASRASLLESASHAHYLHLATHGWYEPGLARVADASRSRGAGVDAGLMMSRDESVRELSPLVLCGLALAGANREPDAPDAGSVTAEELATLDLSGCELAVLSACETARGRLRAGGQGVASLQKSLHMAGARSVLTSLWNVPDEATRELMVRFYRNMWIDGQPKAHALWDAKEHLRAMRDAQGRPLYTTRDWAGWVLTGAPD